MKDNGNGGNLRLFLGCFMSLIATAFGFIVRATLLNEWRLQFNLTGTELGNIGGAGLYPFAISIILFSLVIDKVGYGRAMAVAFVGHVASAIMTLTAQSYQMLYWGTFIFALSNGVVEAVINPVVATVYSKNKTHWLNILHAGWPGGLVVGGLLAIAMTAIPGLGDMLPGKLWQWKVGLVLLPTLAYGVLLFGQKFPVQERVTAGVSYMQMLQEFGAGSCFIVSYLLIAGFSQVLGVLGVEPLPFWAPAAIAILPTVAFGLYVKSFGRPMFVFLLLVMFLLATTELGTDSWIAAIMESVLKSNIAGSLVLVYTSFIMFVLRFFAGPIVHRISPLGLLAVSAALATAGLLWLSNAGNVTWLIFLAATCYGVGKTFFWPTTLGVVSEQYPKGGALLLNTIAGVGMLAVGVLGQPIIGNIQDVAFDNELAARNKTLHDEIITTKVGIFGEYQALDQEKNTALNDEIAKIRKDTVARLNSSGTKPTDEQVAAALSQTSRFQTLSARKETIDAVDTDTKQATLAKIAILPAIMFLCYLGLIVYFMGRGGYKAEVLTGHKAEDEKFTGGVEAPVE
jgi:MFS family permease